MLKIEVIGNQELISAAKPRLTLLTDTGVKEYHHRGIGGEADIVGLIITLAPDVLPLVFNILKPLVSSNTPGVTLRVKNPENAEIELSVGNIKEASELLDILAVRGILPKTG